MQCLITARSAIKKTTKKTTATKKQKKAKTKKLNIEQEPSKNFKLQSAKTLTT